MKLFEMEKIAALQSRAMSVIVVIASVVWAGMFLTSFIISEFHRMFPR